MNNGRSLAHSSLTLFLMAALCSVQFHCSRKNALGPTAPDLTEMASRGEAGYASQSFAAVPTDAVPETGTDMILTNQTITSKQVFESTASITAGSNFVLAGGSEVVFHLAGTTGKRIVLKPGFTAKAGSKFHALSGTKAASSVRIEANGTKPISTE